MSSLKTISGRSIHPIGLGTFGMGGGNHPIKPGQVFGTPYRDFNDIERHIRALRHAITLGQNFIDTAEMYSLGLAEQIVGQAIWLTDRRDLFIASKVAKPHLQHPEHMRSAVEAMIGRLGLSGPLDLLYIHSPNYPDTHMPSYLAALDEVMDAGLTRLTGVCNFDLEQLEQARRLSRHPISTVQNLYNPLYHHEGGNKVTFTPELQAYCRDHGIEMVAHTPLHVGQVCHHAELRACAHEQRLTPAQLSLAWIRRQGIIPIPKASTLEHLDENVQAAEIKLEAKVAAKLCDLPSIGLPHRGITAPQAAAR
jgi:2,5-diketo-D-gluconate reductase B